MSVITTTPADDYDAPSQSKPASEVNITASPARIPTDRYTSRDFLPRETEKLWLGVWQMACREADVEASGDFFEYIIGAQSYLIVRGERA